MKLIKGFLTLFIICSLLPVITFSQIEKNIEKTGGIVDVEGIIADVKYRNMFQIKDQKYTYNVSIECSTGFHQKEKLHDWLCSWEIKITDSFWIWEDPANDINNIKIRLKGDDYPFEADIMLAHENEISIRAYFMRELFRREGFALKIDYIDSPSTIWESNDKIMAKFNELLMELNNLEEEVTR